MRLSEGARLGDSVALIGGMEWNYTQTAKTSPKMITLSQEFATGTNTYVTLESPVATDYQVPTGKELHIMELLVGIGATAHSALILGYGDTAVAEGTAAPTNPVRFQIANWPLAAIGTNTVVSLASATAVASTPGSARNPLGLFLGTVPAGKYPFAQKNAAGIITMYGWGLEVST